SLRGDKRAFTNTACRRPETKAPRKRKLSARMKLVTWNIQWGRGLDGRVDLERIVREARALADFDVLCMQEIADNFPGLAGNDDRDQFAELARLLPSFTRYSVLSVRRHALPWPADRGKSTMPRVAIEATLQAPMGPLRLTTTHLEYYSDAQRRAQARALRHLHDEACHRSSQPGDPAVEGGPFDATRQTIDAILTGDFNFPPEHPAY